MRLLQYNDRGTLSLTKDLPFAQVPPYAILSHTWGHVQDEVSFQELDNRPDQSKIGYQKLEFCGQQAKRDGLEYFWVDTCCIDRKDSHDVAKNINLMFRYYQQCQKCYVYLSDVDRMTWKSDLGDCKWFRRGWTLQELIAPASVEFYSRDQTYIGNKTTLEQNIHEITRVPTSALRGANLSQFEKNERMRWTASRETTEEEDQAYCLLGIFDVSLSVDYGEGKMSALARLETAIRTRSKPTWRDFDCKIRDYYLSHHSLDVKRLSNRNLSMDTCFANIRHTQFYLSKSHSRESADRGAGPFELTARLKIKTPPRSKRITLQALFTPQNNLPRLEGRPDRFVIWGEAGTGKSVLCKKIVYDFYHNNLWRDLFDRVLWLSLHRLKLIGNEVKTVSEMIQLTCFYDAKSERLPMDALDDIVSNSGSRTLFVLDGLDKVSSAYDHEPALRTNLNKLMRQKNLIITSRPHYTRVLDAIPLFLELEIIGLLPQQVNAFLAHDDLPEVAITEIKTLMKRSPIARNLVRITTIIDALCFSWEEDQFQQDKITMTLFYQEIVDRIWRKDVERLNMQFQGVAVAAQEVPDSVGGGLPADHMSCRLEQLAFASLYDGVVEFNLGRTNTTDGHQTLLLDEYLSQSSFFRSSGGLENSSHQTYYFIHFTIQEFFAARYFVRHWSSNKEMNFPQTVLTDTQSLGGTETVLPADFIGKEKYSSRCDIFWRFVIGLLQLKSGNQALDRFFQEFESEPCDILGLSHQMLMIHCLNEVVGDRGDFAVRADQLEQNFQRWTESNASLDMCADLIGQAECPYSVLKHWSEHTDTDMQRVLQILGWREDLPPELQDLAIERARLANDEDAKQRALVALAMHCDQLSPEKFADLLLSPGLDAWTQACDKFFQGCVGNALLQHVTHLLCDKDVAVRSRAAVALEHQDVPRSTINLLTRLLQDQHIEVRSGAAQALRRRNDLPESTVKALIPLLLEEDRNARLYAAWALAEQISLPEFATEALVPLLCDEDIWIRYGVTKGFANQASLSESVLGSLHQLLDNEDFEARENALRALERQTNLSESMIEGVLRCLLDQFSSIRSFAAHRLEDQTSMSEPVIQTLVALLHDRDLNTRFSAATALSNQIEFRDTVVQTFCQVIREEVEIDDIRERPGLRSQAVWNLGRRILLSKSTVEVLVPLLHDKQIQSHVAWVLDKTSLPTSAIDTIVQLLQHPDQELDPDQYPYQQSDLWDLAISQLNKLPTISKPHLHFLVRSLKSRMTAAFALKVLVHHAEFYELFAALDSDSLINVLQCLLRQGLRESRPSHLILHDNVLLIEIDGIQWTVPLKDSVQEIFRQRWAEARRTIGLPPLNPNFPNPSSLADQKESTSRRTTYKL